MTFNRYVITVVLPNLIFCKLVGMTSLSIERVARKVRLLCAHRLKRVVMGAPPKQSSES